MQLNETIIELLNNGIELLAFVMLLMAIFITTARTIHQMIPYYQGQCISLALITLFTAIKLTGNSEHLTIGAFLVMVFAAIPILLALYIRPLLVQATVAETMPFMVRLRSLLNSPAQHAAQQQAIPAWLSSHPARRGSVWILLFDLVLMFLAFVISYTLMSGGYHPSGVENLRTSANVLGVSFTLLLLGISTMSSKEDIIAQVMGLLMMEQGMFLAAVGVNPQAEMIVYFILGLFVYIAITLTILVFLLPELHHISGSVDVDQQSQLKG